jgi:hypothetical protein
VTIPETVEPEVGAVILTAGKTGEAATCTKEPTEGTPFELRMNSK